MIVKGLGFIETVKYLKKLLPQNPEGPVAAQQQLNQLLDGIGKSIGD